MQFIEQQTVSKKVWNDMCARVRYHAYESEGGKLCFANETNMVDKKYLDDTLDVTDVIAFQESGTKGDWDAFACIRLVYNKTKEEIEINAPVENGKIKTATIDIMCSRGGKGKGLVQYVEKSLESRGIRYVRAYAVPSRVLYWHNLGYICSHNENKEDPDVTKHFDLVNQYVDAERKKHPEQSIDRIIRKCELYVKILQRLIEMDMLRTHYMNIPLRRIRPYTESDNNGYAMLKYL
jgi:hypothetical protein